MATAELEAAPESIAHRLDKTADLLPVSLALLVYAIITITILIRSFLLADHHLVYALDDPYITMAMARSLATHGIWGLTPYSFSSSSSTPLFTVILAVLYRAFGITTWMPLLLSWGFGAASVVAADRLAARYLEPRDRTLALLLFILTTPLFAIGVLGMEHTLHLFLALTFLLYFSEDGPTPLRLMALGSLMAATRYESLFLLGPAVVVLMTRRLWKHAMLLATGTASPICAYGVYSLAHGGSFLPNSVALKGVSDVGIHALLMDRIATAVRGADLLFPSILLAIACYQLRVTRPRLALLTLLVSLSGFLHLAAARVGAAFRYEAYGVGIAVLLLACTTSSLGEFSRRARVTFAGLLFLAAFPVGVRSLLALTSYPGYSRAIYLQQWQMASFLRTYFPAASVAANDIGAISFFTNIHCTDLVGLADSGIFTAKRAGRYNTAFLQSYLADRDVQFAMVYDAWFFDHSHAFFLGPALPKSWILVGKLTTPDSENVGGNVVSFYAVRPDRASALTAALLSFRPSLPAADRLEIR